MPYCPNCRTRANPGVRVCENCGARIPQTTASKKARKRAQQKRIFLIWICLITLAVLIAAIWTISRRDTPDNSSTAGTKGSSSAGTLSSGSVSSTSSSSTASSGTAGSTSTEATHPTTVDMYSREELEALENEAKSFGPGTTSNGVRPPYAVSDQSKYEAYGSNFIGPDDGNIYLTFDCGYEYYAKDENGNSYRVTEKILDVLKEKNVKAVFFVTMYYVEDQPDLVRRMIDEGHVVGNHSNNHPIMPDLTIDEMIYEVMSLHEYVEENFGYSMTLFRPPTGAYSTQSLAVVQNLGYKTVHWSFAYLDYDTANQPDKAAALAKVTGSHHSGAIYLLHAVSETNAAILGDAIDFFRAQGYSLEPFQ